MKATINKKTKGRRADLGKIRDAVRESLMEVKKQNKNAGITNRDKVIVKEDGVYILSNSGKLKLLKKGNYKKVSLPKTLL